jgi:Rhs element Vgr protein
MPLPLIPTQSYKTDLPTFTVLTNGEAISTGIEVIGITIEECVNKIAKATLIVKDGNTADQRFDISNTDSFSPGSVLRIMAGYHKDEQSVFEGIILRHSVKFNQGSPSLLVVECKDAAFKLARRRQNRQFSSRTDSAILGDILDLYPDIKGRVEAITRVTHANMVQYATTDWDFIVSRAEMNNLLVYNAGGEITIKDIPATDSSEPALQNLVTLGSNVYAFDAEIDASSQMSRASCYGWDPQQMEVSEDSSESGFENRLGDLDSQDLAEISGANGEGIFQHMGVSNKGRSGDVNSELTMWAKSAMSKSAMAKVRGTARIQGTHEVKPGKFVRIEGVGNKFNGNAFVSAVRHEIDPSNWYTILQFGMDAEWFYQKHSDIAELPAAGLVPAIQGLQIGTVTQISDDPLGIGRVKVKMPFLKDPVAGAESEDGVWARMITLYGGDKVGFEFFPEIDSEVILGFLNGDPRDAIILGPVHNQKRDFPNGFTPNDDNHIKGIYTRSGMKLEFDDQKVAFILETPKGNVIEVTEDGNMIRFIDAKGMGIEINPQNVFIGKENGHTKLGSQPLVLGDALYQLLKKLLTSFTMPIVPQAPAGTLSLLNIVQIQQAILELEQIRSDHVRITKNNR